MVPIFGLRGLLSGSPTEMEGLTLVVEATGRIRRNGGVRLLGDVSVVLP